MCVVFSDTLVFSGFSLSSHWIPFSQQFSLIKPWSTAVLQPPRVWLVSSSWCPPNPTNPPSTSPWCHPAPAAGRTLPILKVRSQTQSFCNLFNIQNISRTTIVFSWSFLPFHLMLWKGKLNQKLVGKCWFDAYLMLFRYKMRRPCPPEGLQKCFRSCLSTLTVLSVVVSQK